MDLILIDRNRRGSKDPQFQTRINIPNWMWGAVKDEAKAKGTSENSVVRNALAEHFRREGRKNTPSIPFVAP